MAFGDIKDLNRRTATNKVLHDKVFDIAKDPRYDGYQSGLASMIYNFFLVKQLLVVVLKIFLIKN